MPKIKGEAMIKIDARVPATLKDQLAIIAAKKNTKTTKLIRKILENYIQSYNL